MNSVIKWLEDLFESIPLSLMEVWGRFGFLLGFILMVFAFAGFTFRPGGRWGLGREKHAWDSKFLISIILTFVFVSLTGYVGSFIVLVPGAQTFESLKDLSVFVCILLFGYPALLTVPFAYGISDLIEGVPPEFLFDWLPGYFINPTCFWIAYQFIGKNPDFKKASTWKWYLLFVIIFMSLEPALWGYLCSEKFTSEISYRIITPALFFTTSITWLIAPFVMLIAFPLSKKSGFFWAKIQGRVKEYVPGQKKWIWESGDKANDETIAEGQGVPIRLFLAAPFIALVLLIVGTTAFFTLRSSELSSIKLAERIHQEVSENINLKLDDYLESARQNKQVVTTGDLNQLLSLLPIAKHGRALIIHHSGKLVASSHNRFDTVEKNAIKNLSQKLKEKKLSQELQFHFDIITAKPLSKETWMAQATPYQDKQGQHSDWILITVIAEAYFLQGIREGNSQSAMVFAVALIIAIAIAGIIASIVTGPIYRILKATQDVAAGNLSQRVPESRLGELSTLSSSFNNMAQKLQTTFESLSESEQRFKQSENRLHLSINSAKLGTWEWDIEKNIIVWDKTMFQQYGWEGENLTVNPDKWIKSVVKEDFERLMGEAKSAFKSAKEFNTEFRIIWPDSSIHYIKGDAKIIRNENGRAIRMVGINADITDRKRNEEELLKYRNHLEELVNDRTIALKNKTEQLEASKIELEKNIKSKEELEALVQERSALLIEKEKFAALGFMSAGFAHEIKNPLNLIHNAAEIISLQLKKIETINTDMDEKTTAALSKLKEGNQIILMNGKRVDNIIKTLLLQARSSKESLVQSIVIEDVLKSNLDFVLANYRPKINNRINVEIINDDSKLSIMANPVDLGRVFINLIDNSCYAIIQKINSDPQFFGELKVSIEAKNHGVGISIRDNGIGIPQAKISQVFTPFYTSKPPGEGTGLGLNFAYEIIKAHGGNIDIRSVQNQFTEIFIFLPLKGQE